MADSIVCVRKGQELTTPGFALRHIFTTNIMSKMIKSENCDHFLITLKTLSFPQKTGIQ